MSKELEAIRKRLGHLTLEWQPDAHLDTGVPDLNAVLGHREKGLMYGHIIELAGWESQGKSAVALSVAALAQQDDAAVIWLDFEHSFDPVWATTRGIKVEGVNVIQPYVGKFGKEAKARLASAQDLCHEAELLIESLHKKFKKVLLVVDSIPAMLTEGEAAGGIDSQNMRTNMDLPMFLSRLLRRWVGMAQTHGVLIFLINQLRSKPDMYNPEYTPGGNAVRFYCHVRARIRRAKGGKIKQGGKNVGIQGIITNFKNKSGSPEGSKIGFKLRFAGPFEFCPADKLERAED